VLRATQALAHLDLVRPTLLLDAARVRRNIDRMARKAGAAGVRFRPHFKTHQSAAIGEWFRSVGVDAITVSSFDMGRYFQQHGWSDITVAFPLNVREMDAVHQLAAQATLGVLVDSDAAVEVIESHLRAPVNVWIKIDVGARRSGVAWTDPDAVLSLARRLLTTQHAHFVGLLTHAGHSYDAGDRAGVAAIHAESLLRMREVRTRLADAGVAARISIGDTPGCSIADDFGGVDEMRPGNFVFYDLVQADLGACDAADVAIALACPVVGKHPDRNEIVLYGGAVHLSKDALHTGGRTLYGCLARWEGSAWTRPEPRAPLVSLSQEHGVVRLDPEDMDGIGVGDLVTVIPVHSCLTSDLFDEYRVLDGSRIARRQSNQTPLDP